MAPQKSSLNKIALRNVLTPYNQGEAISATEPKSATIECFRAFKQSEPRIFAAQLVSCDENDAPRRYHDSCTSPPFLSHLCTTC